MNKLILLLAMAVALATNVTAQVGAIDLNRPQIGARPALTSGAAERAREDAEIHLPDASRSHN